MVQNESLENKRKRLIFRSEHRGTKEMDLLMGSFAQQYVADFTEVELNWYDEVMNNNDPNLYNWIIGEGVAPPEIGGALFDKLKAHTPLSSLAQSPSSSRAQSRDLSK